MRLLLISVALTLIFGGYAAFKKIGSAPPERNAYYLTKRSIFEAMPKNTGGIVFLGNSITDYCDWHELFGMPEIRNRGIGRDVIPGVIDRVDEVLVSKPDKIFLMIGINDLGEGVSVDQILTDYEKLCSMIVSRSPDTDLYIQSILPTRNKEAMQNADIIEINKGLVELSERVGVIYIDLFNSFQVNDELNPDYTFDGLHLNGQGYLVWKELIEEYVLGADRLALD